LKRVIAYSSGKDSTALLLWAKEQFPLEEILVMFNDTLWEHELVYGYLAQMKEELLKGVEFHQVPSIGMEALVELKHRVPSPKARFCTEHLKVNPCIEFLKTIQDDYELYDGKRREESESRSQLPEREWSDSYDCWVNHPLAHWTVEQVFAIAQKYGVSPNPLYLKNAGRVGCFPCVLINHRELKAFMLDAELGPEVRRRIERLEQICGRSFFPPNYIPKRYQTGHDPKSGKTFCWSADVFTYLEMKTLAELPWEESKSCMSIYNLCGR
jgi:3'-phosphoadenosine 5'-phosphosulfate sulfotransferase (PAPS reductase)/FAD synthetase